MIRKIASKLRLKNLIKSFYSTFYCFFLSDLWRAVKSKRVFLSRTAPAAMRPPNSAPENSRSLF